GAGGPVPVRGLRARRRTGLRRAGTDRSRSAGVVSQAAQGAALRRVARRSGSGGGTEAAGSGGSQGRETGQDDEGPAMTAGPVVTLSLFLPSSFSRRACAGPSSARARWWAAGSPA